MLERRRVRLVLELDAERASLVALRLALRSPRYALALRHALAEALERVAAERTDAPPGVWRFTVVSGKLEPLPGEGGASEASEPPKAAE